MNCLKITVGVLCAQLIIVTVYADLPVYRLPQDVIPHHYDLRLLTDLEDFTFSGHVDIQIECKKSTDTIKLHSVSLQIPVEGITLKRESDAENLKVSSATLDSDNDFLIIKTAEALKPGDSYILHVPFGSKLIGSLIGYYRSSYWDSISNTTKWMAVSHFEPTSARRAFPCFDEPAMKAKFRIHLGHKPHLHGISNMPLIRTQSIDGLMWDEFMETVPMSTYLVAFVVSEFEHIQSNPENSHVLFRVWARKEALHQGEFAVNYGPKFLNFFENFFGISFPLPKQDMVAIPDFDQGAMENWGLITYREAQFLLDENSTAAPTRFAIANTVAHELAHQWFGNLVTMKWWTDLWLNEGFATFMAAFAMQHQFPEWNSYNFDIVSNIQRTFALDGLKSSHPVSVPIGNPRELNQIFDAISYSKGSLLIHMMNAFLGEDVFRSGVSNYLKALAYSNSEQDDLWASLTVAAVGKQLLPPGGVTVKHIMDQWTLQPGYPVIKVQREGGKVTVSQKRFLAIHEIEKMEGKECWWVPLTFSTAKNPGSGKAQNTYWLSCGQPSLTFDIPDVTHDDWILINNKASGIFRVNYDEHSWKLLTEALRGPHRETMDELGRFLLVSDAMALARSGELEYEVALPVLKSMHTETMYGPWSGAIAALRELELLLWRTENYDVFKKVVHELIADVFKRFSDLKQVSESMDGLRLQRLVISWACKYHVGDCVQSATQLFKQWLTGGGTNMIPKDLRTVIYCEGLRNGGEEDWQKIWQHYLTSNVANEKATFLYALSCPESETLLNRLLEYSIDVSSGVRRQDAGRVFYDVANSSPVGYKVALDFIRKNIQRIYNYLSPDTKDLGRYVQVLATGIVFPEELYEMKRFIAENEKLLEKGELSVKQGMESAESNLIWMSAFYKKVSQALNV